MAFQFTERLALLIDAKTGGARREIKGLTGDVRGLGGATDTMAPSLAGAGLLMRGAVAGGAAYAAVKMGQLSLASLRTASDLQQASSAVDVVFGDARDVLDEFADTAVEAAGLSERAVFEMGARVGASLKGMGLSAMEAAETTVFLEQRAADLAATFGGTTAQAIDAIAALLRGERDPIERYGVALKEADVNARIAALGLNTATTEAEKQARVIASLDLLMGATADSAGQFARESGQLAVEQQKLDANLEQLQANMAKGLLPTVGAAVELFNKGFGVVEDFAGGIDTLADSIGSLPGRLPGWLEEGIDIATWAIPGVNVVKGLDRALSDSGDAAEEAAVGTDRWGDSLDRLVDRADRAIGTADELAEGMSLIGDAFFGAVDAQDSYADALEAVDDATRDLARAKHGLADATADETRRQAEANREIERAARGLASANFEVERALFRRGETAEDVADAERALTEAVRDYGPNSRAAREAADELEDARFREREALFGVEEAQGRVVDAQDRLVDAQERAVRRHDEVRDAVERVRDAEDKLRDSQDELARSAIGLEEKLDEQRSTLSDTNEEGREYLAWLEAVKRKHPEAAASLDPLIGKLRDALALYERFPTTFSDARNLPGRFLTGATAPDQFTGASGATVTLNIGPNYIGSDADLNRFARDIAWEARNSVVSGPS